MESSSSRDTIDAAAAGAAASTRMTSNLPTVASAWSSSSSCNNSTSSKPILQPQPQPNSAQLPPLNLRPTEAQLRWAQFHHKRRALSLQEKLERFYQTPVSTRDVEGAGSDDGNSTTTTTSSGSSSSGASVSSIRRRRQRRLQVSRGRRALLRVSKRLYNQRKDYIRQHGFQRYNEQGLLSDEEDEHGKDEDSEDDLAAIFAEESWRKRRQKQRRRQRKRLAGRGRGGVQFDDLDRIQRFEQAFHSMMMTLAAAQQKEQSRHEIITATRIWKRSMEPADLDFTQWRLPTNHKHQQYHHPYAYYQQQHLKTQSTSALEADAKAPLLVLDPHQNNKINNEPTESMLNHLQNSHPRRSYRELVEILQQQVDDRLHSPHIDPHFYQDSSNNDSSSPPPSPPRMRLVDKFFHHPHLQNFEEKKEQEYDEVNDDYHRRCVEEEAKELERLATSLLPELLQRPSTGISSSDPSNLNLIDELELAEPGISKKIFTLYLQDNAATPYTARQQLLTAARRHLELYALAYLSQNHDPQPPPPHEQSSSIVRHMVEQLEQVLLQEKRDSSLVWQDGKLHKPEFARLVQQYLLQVRRQIQQHQQGSTTRIDDLSFPSQDDDKLGDKDFDYDDPFAKVLNEQQCDSEDDDHELEENDFFHNEAGDENDLHSLDLLIEQLLHSNEEELVDSSGYVTDLFKDMVAHYLEQATTKKQWTMSRSSTIDLDDKTMVSTVEEHHLDFDPVALNVEDAKVIELFSQEFAEQLLRANETIEPVFMGAVSALNTTNSEEHQGEVRLVKPALEKFALRFIQQLSETPKNQNASNFFQEFRSPEALALARQQSARKKLEHHSRSYNHHPQQHQKQTLGRSAMRPPALESPVTTRKFIQVLQTKLEQEISKHPERTTMLTTSDPLSVSVLKELVEQALVETIVAASCKEAATTNVSRSQRDHSMLPHQKSFSAGDSATSLTEPLFDDLEDFVQPFVAHLEHHILSGTAESSRRDGSPRLDQELVRHLVDLCLPRSVRSCAEVFVDSFVNDFMDSFPKSLDGVLDPAVLQDIVRDCAEQAAHEYANVSASADNASTALVEANKSAKRITSGSILDTSMASKLADTVSDKFGGLFGMKWYHNEKQDNDGELQAVAAFRKNRQERHGTDDTSSLSSFRVPESLRKVVQNFRLAGHMMGDHEEEEASGQSSLMQLESAASQDDNSHPSSYPPSRGESDFSPEHVRNFHKKVMEKSNRSIIDTDGTEVSHSALNPALLSNLLLSPTILSKRLQQAIRAVEARSWDQVSYLMNANPWLAEMTDLKTNQYLLHKVALYGSSVQQEYAPPSEALNTDLIRMFPAAVHKFDHDGNLPLHMAAASANLAMIRLLGDRFPSGASVRNEDGMLPLHLVILALASPHTNHDSSTVDKSTASELVKTVLEYFPGAVAIADNEGNLPLHAAASALKGDIGVEVVYLLQDEAERQVSSGARFRNNVRVKGADNESIGTESANPMTDIDEEIFCSLVRNEQGETPLMVAVHSRSGWKMIEALVSGPGGAETVLCQDSELNNALHILVHDQYRDPKAVMSILKVAPEAARVKNAGNMIPFEIACRQGVPREVLLAIVLIDLPFDLDDTECQNCHRDGCGASWFFLTCECDDAYVDIVEEVVSLCSYPQARELCFIEVGVGETLLARATPKCRSVLQRSLRFLGRFEFVSTLLEEKSAFRLFDAIDFGTKEEPIADGRGVILKCYIEQDLFERETYILRKYDLDFSLLEEVQMFGVGENGLPTTASVMAKQYCVSIEQSNLTLEGVVAGMLANHDCQSVPSVRKRYAEKAFAVLRLVAKGLRHLHSLGLVHGSLSLRTFAKYQNRWKLCNVLDILEAGQGYTSIPRYTPPELLETGSNPNMRGNSCQMQPPVDVWAFGNLAYEVLVGKPLFPVDEAVELLRLRDMSDIHRTLVNDACIPSAWAEFILSCLSPNPAVRPTMADALRQPFWKDIHRHSGSDE